MYIFLTSPQGSFITDIFTRHNKHLETRKYSIFELLNIKRNVSKYIFLNERQRPCILVRNHLNLNLSLQSVSFFNLNVTGILMLCMELKVKYGA